jgi:hypothetical protein
VGTVQQAVITDASFTSKIIRASNHILVTPANTTARGLGVATTSGTRTAIFVPLATMTNNASILLTYTNPNPAAPVSFYFFVFGGGTNT